MSSILTQDFSLISSRKDDSSCGGVPGPVNAGIRLWQCMRMRRIESIGFFLPSSILRPLDNDRGGADGRCTDTSSHRLAARSRIRGPKQFMLMRGRAGDEVVGGAHVTST